MSSQTWNCYTCKRLIKDKKNAHTAHFIASSLCSVEMRYDLGNLRICCYDCNINKNGHTLQFRRNLIANHRIEYVEELEARNEATKGKTYPIIWFQEKIIEYQQILQSL